MKRAFIILILMCFFLMLLPAEDNSWKNIDPEIHLQKANEAVKADPDSSMDLAKSILLFSKGNDNKYFEIKARLIIGKAFYYKNNFQEALKTLTNVKARILMLNDMEKSKKILGVCAESFFWLGEIYLKMNRYRKSLVSYQKALKYCDLNNNSILKSKIVISISRAYLLLSEYENTIAYAIRGKKYAKESGDVESLFFSFYLHGYVCREMKEYENGLVKFERSLEISKENNRIDLKIMALNEISNIYFLQKKYDEALELKQNALKIAVQTENSKALSYCLNDIAIIFMENKEYMKALPYFIRSRELAKEDSNIRGEVITDISIANLYSKTGNISKSRILAIKALNLAEKHGLKLEVMDLTKFLSDLAFRANNFKDAFKYLERSFKLNRDIFSTEKSKKIAELETDIEMEKNENKILLLEKVNEIKQLELNKQKKFITLQKLITFMLIISVLFFFFAYRWKIKANLQLKKKSEELEKTLTEIHQLSGLLPMCSSCKKIRDDSGYWHQVEEYINSHSEASFSHSMCPSCIKEVYPDIKTSKPKSKKKSSKKKDK